MGGEWYCYHSSVYELFVPPRIVEESAVLHHAVNVMPQCLNLWDKHKAQLSEQSATHTHARGGHEPVDSSVTEGELR